MTTTNRGYQAVTIGEIMTREDSVIELKDALINLNERLEVYGGERDSKPYIGTLRTNLLVLQKTIDDILRSSLEVG